jgi:hypothetical protein
VVAGDLLLTIPWVPVSPVLERALQLLDRHRWLPAGLAVGAVAAGLLMLVGARRRGLALLVLGLSLAGAAFLVRPVATSSASWFVGDQQPGLDRLSRAAVVELLAGWSAVSGALIAIGLALALVGLVLGVRRRR